MPDNDFTSGDPWGLSDTDTEEAPLAPPPVPTPVSDELPADLADLSTIADSDVGVAPDVEDAVKESLSNLADEANDDANDLDLGDLGDFSDLASHGDLGPLEISDLPDSSDTADPDADPTIDALADLSSLSADLADADADFVTAPTTPSPAASRPLNPLLAASGLFGGSPTLPPLKDSAPDSDDSEQLIDAAGDDSSDQSIHVSAGDIDFDAIELASEADDFAISDVDAVAVDIEEPADIEAELADTLNALGDQPSDAITFSSDVSLGEIEEDEGSFTDDAGSSFETNADDIVAEREEEDFYPEFMTVTDTDESGDTDAEGPEGESAEVGFGEPDFTTPSEPPAIYHELENLGDVANIGNHEPADTTDEVDGSEAESASEFAAVFGGSKPAEDDPFGAVFGSGDDAIDAVAAAASSVEMTHTPAPVEPAATPTVDDLPDFLIDEDTETPTDGSSVDGNDPADAGESVGSTEDDNGDSPASWLGFGESATPTDDDQDDDEDDDEEAIDDDFADGAFALGESDTRSIEVTTPVEVSEAIGDNAAADSAQDDSAQDDSAHEVADHDIAEGDSSVDPLPPMRDASPAAPFEADPFAHSAFGSLKVDSADLESAAFDSPDLPPDVEPVEGDAVSDAAAHATVSSGGPGQAPIIGTVATGVIEKKPIPEDWGTRSDDAYEGWVQDDDGVETWRMIITNLPTVAGYDIDEFLGLAVADSLVVSHDVEAVASGRRAAIDALTEDGVLRGAHAIVAVTHAVQAMGTQMLVTVSGTAVTLKPTASTQAD